jgi:hypothetical protein
VSVTRHGILTDKLPRLIHSLLLSQTWNGPGDLPHNIEAHGNHLMAENNSDGGATFCFTLPVAKEKVCA